MNIDIILSRLNKVQKTSKLNEYKALCPAHEDKNPSLSIGELPDGRILINCFVGCESKQVLDSIGLSFEDLFPQKLGDFKSEKKPFSSNHGLKLIGYESSIILACAGFLREGKELSEANFSRMVEAVTRIQNVLRACGL
jgi:DNA primase